MAHVGSHSPLGKLRTSLSIGTFLMQMASVPAVWLTAAASAHAARGFGSPGTFTSPVTCNGTGSDGMTLNNSSVTASGGGTTNNHAVRAERAGGGSIFLNASNVALVNTTRLTTRSGSIRWWRAAPPAQRSTCRARTASRQRAAPGS